MTSLKRNYLQKYSTNCNQILLGYVYLLFILHLKILGKPTEYVLRY